jgi:MFS family permease
VIGPLAHHQRFGFAAFHHPLYRLFWSGQLVTNVGSWMQVVGTGWLMLQLTNSAAYLGFNGLFLAVPILVFSILGGLVADRVDRYRLLVGTQLAQVVPDTALALLVATGAVQVWHIFLYLLVWGTVRGLSSPGRQALVPSLVPDEDLQSAVALNSVLWQGAAVVGPMLAGFTLHQWGLASIFYLNVASDLIYLLALALLRVPPMPPRPRHRSPARELWEGACYAWQQPNVRALLLAVAAISFFDRSYTQLMPVFARDVFAVGAQGLGVLLAMPAAGTIAAAVLLGATPQLGHRGPLVLAAGAVLALALIGFAASRSFALSLPLLFIVGAAATTATSQVNTLLQQMVPDEMRGRIMSFYMDATQGASYLGALPVGLAAARWGAPLAVDLSAAVSLLVVVALALSARGLRRLN